MRWVTGILVNMLLGANLVSLVLLWACCATTWVDPAMHPRVSVLGLAFPLFLVVNLTFILLWLLFKPRMLVVPVVGMAVCAGFILDYFPLGIGGDKGNGDTLTVLTWNIHNPIVGGEELVKEATDYMASVNPDVICLQEFNARHKSYAHFLDSLEREGFYIDRTVGRTIISRFPVMSQEVVDAESYATNGATKYLLDRDGDTLTLFNLHLECNRLSEAEKNEYGEVVKDPSRTRLIEELRYMIDKLSASSRYRAYQVDSLSDQLDALEGGSVLLCGDFNDTPISYAYQQMAKRLGNAFREKGFGVGVTFTERLFPIRIDHIFHSSDWTCVEARVDNYIGASDHYPVVAKLVKKEK